MMASLIGINAGLVVVAVQHPLLKLLPGQTALVHEDMKGVMGVITLAAFPSQTLN